MRRLLVFESFFSGGEQYVFIHRSQCCSWQWPSLMLFQAWSHLQVIYCMRISLQDIPYRLWLRQYKDHQSSPCIVKIITIMPLGNRKETLSLLYFFVFWSFPFWYYSWYLKGLIAWYQFFFSLLSVYFRTMEYILNAFIMLNDCFFFSFFLISFCCITSIRHRRPICHVYVNKYLLFV